MTVAILRRRTRHYIQALHHAATYFCGESGYVKQTVAMAASYNATRVSRLDTNHSLANSADLQVRHQKLFTLARHLSVGHFE